jgi:integrase
MAKYKLTKSVVEKLPLPTGKQTFIYDTVISGFGVRLSAKTKAFFVERRVAGKTRRHSLGHYPDITVDQARKRAETAIGQMTNGIDPNEERKQKAAASLTLADVYAAFRTDRKKLTPTTLKQYDDVMTRLLVDWANKPWHAISGEMVVKRIVLLKKSHGPSMANSAMRVLRSVLNYAISSYKRPDGTSMVLDNPVKRLSDVKGWYPVKPRETFIRAHQLAAWHKSVCNLPSHTARDFLLLTLFTGLRRNEAASLRWSDIDFIGLTFKVEDTKNGETLTLPITEYLLKLLKARLQFVESEYVFPAKTGEGYYNEPRRALERIKRETGIKFTVHDLRRTYITYAEAQDIPAYALKALVNHKAKKSDVTAMYIQMTPERLREPMARVSRFLLEQIHNVQ